MDPVEILYIMEKNAILAAVLSMAILIGWQYIVVKPMENEQVQKQKVAKARAAAQNKGRSSAASAPLKAPASGFVAPGAPATPSAPTQASPGRLVRVDVGDAVYELTNRGAGFLSARLLKYKQGKQNFVELAPGGRPDVRPLFFWGGKTAQRLNEASYQVEGGDLSLSKDHPEGTVRFLYRGADGLSAEKAFSFRHNEYNIQTKIRVTRPSGKEAMGIVWGPRVGGSDGNTYGGVIEGPMSFVGEDLEYDYPEEAKSVTHGEKLKWTSLQSKHFIAALIPRSGAGGAEIRLLSKTDDLSEYAAIVPLSQGTDVEAVFDVYVGPKALESLEKLKVNLEDSLDYGKFSFIANPLMSVLRAFHSVVGNWGVSIILLTILVKIIFYPLTHVSMRNMKEMQKLQPRITQLREIYKDDKSRLNEQTMGLYKEHKVNPMMGCLPMIIQIPVFFGLYEALLVSIELRNAPFFGWVQDLSVQDPYHVYTILMGASMFLQQKMTPTAADPTQAKMMMFMPIVFTGMFIFYPVPVGLVIYWLVNNLLSIAQQLYVNRSVQPPKLAEEN